MIDKSLVIDCEVRDYFSSRLRVPHPRHAVDLPAAPQAALHRSLLQVHEHNVHPLEPHNLPRVVGERAGHRVGRGGDEGVAARGHVAVARDLEAWVGVGVGGGVEVRVQGVGWVQWVGGGGGEDGCEGSRWGVMI